MKAEKIPWTPIAFVILAFAVGYIIHHEIFPIMKVDGKYVIVGRNEFTFLRGCAHDKDKYYLCMYPGYEYVITPHPYFNSSRGPIHIHDVGESERINLLHDDGYDPSKTKIVKIESLAATQNDPYSDCYHTQNHEFEINGCLQGYCKNKPNDANECEWGLYTRRVLFKIPLL